MTASAWRRPRRSLRMRLTLLHSGLFLAVGIAVLTVDNVFGRSDVQRSDRAPADAAVAGAQHGFDLAQMSSGLALAILAVLSVALGWLVSGRVVRPLHTMMAITRNISASKLSDRLGATGTDREVNELARTFDDLLGRLEASFESQRHFVANASHELRTPVAAERTLLQVALADPHASAETMRATCEQLLTLNYQQARLIESLLALAHSERGIDRWTPFNLADLADGVVMARNQEAERRGIRIEATLGPAPAAGDPHLVESLVTNLVDNGLRHNVPGGWLEIATSTVAGRATISVRNTGVQVPSDDIDRLFQPFHRQGDQRTRHADGYGLGLAIVQAIAVAHQAALVAHPWPGGGLEVTVTFPAAD